MEVRVNCVEKRRTSQKTATGAKKMVSLVPCLWLFRSYFFLADVQLADGSAASTLLGTGREVGADEDDFHMILRRNLEIDGDEREETKGLRAGALAGVVKTCRMTSVKPKKGGELLNPEHDVVATNSGSGAKMISALHQKPL